MSLCIDYYVFPENANKKDVIKELREMVRRDSPESSADLSDIDWFEDDPCDNKEEAEKFIQDHDKYANSCLAVRYWELPSNAKTSAKYKKLSDKQKKASLRYDSLRSAQYIRTVKAKFIGCRFCGSRFNRLQMLSDTYGGPNNRCPICGNDFRPETTLKTIKKAEQALLNANQQLQEERDRLAKINGVVKWLVKIEYVS